MSIKKYYSNKEKAGWRWDAAKKQYWSWGFDIRLTNGTRQRESGFASRQLVEQAVARIRISEKEGKYNLQTRTFPLLSEVIEKRLERIENKKERVRSETVFRRWLSMIPKRLRFNELAPAHIQLYIDARLREIKASSINREVTCIVSAIHSAHSRATRFCCKVFCNARPSVSMANALVSVLLGSSERRKRGSPNRKRT